ncbi:hypothetical protein RhiirA5_503179 [Rhizophagus irregularis]|uniref:SAM domain-containing protein n=3 Tax=Rhizophagus irregularis TaxID=588596 RepID=U9T492_RHIID|nr:hypothetical protein GLOIN_2v1789121 [Rhizophagus irregularis DAOM 181602=DAOM 197198]EXX58110.1 hypothetical protein RirG_200920 [Rhizophagus irregularis DAOM 197198w]PKC03810.1 hypothetical protein RhiirA5_503179 [Rhizophagus irregularis]PKC62543.1 hypothetical protein RhiirA1_538419 [Rhizophagus irregularis]PKY27146.1 hypothetical protein RhiirB3_529025 [Rhizophagus irregularis]POG59437.1 hypothetical protein GLOIN_2v1789121 [Rhizophagus irregularis DAOM 181602=DAOM 197198]|eukprot:XP_025166303.1 hypothetical protein GLOIN_2v1789121 [Rhizophagus irregularis DAOM 181602=DAOM 197198]
MSTLQQNPPFLIEEIKNWSPEQVIKFLESKKGELSLNENHIKIIENEEISGLALLSLTKEDLRSFGLKGGPSIVILELIKNLKSEEQTSSVQEVRLNALEDKLTSVQELLQKSVIQQQVEQFNPTQGKGKKRVVEQEQGYENPTKVLKISSTTNVKSTLKSSEMDVDDTNNKVNANILSSNEDICSHHKEFAYNCLAKGDINYLINLIKRHFQSRSMMSLKSMNEAVFQAVLEMLLPLIFRVPELRLIVDGTKQKYNGRFGFVDIFIPGGKDNPSIVLELKYIKLTGLKSGSKGRFTKSLKTTELYELDKNLEEEDDDTVLDRKYMSKNSRTITTVREIMNNGIQQLQNYIRIITRGPVKGYVDSGILDPRVGVTETMKDSGQLMGYVIMSVGTRRMLVRSYGPIKTDICYFSVPK